MEPQFHIYEVEARRPGIVTHTWLTIRVIATDGESALAAAKPLAAEYYGVDESQVSVRVNTPAHKVDALVGLIPS